VRACEMMNDARVGTIRVKISGGKLTTTISSKKVYRRVIVFFSHDFELLECSECVRLVFKQIHSTKFGIVINNNKVISESIIRLNGSWTPKVSM
jgi:hypothetical protein